MGWLDRRFAAAYDPAMQAAERRGLAALRHELLADAGGRVLELGAGTGANLAAYPDAVEHLTLLEPSAPMAERLRDRVAGAGRAAPTEVVEAPAEALPLPDASVDLAVSTLVLCTVGDLDRSLRELRRVLVPGGRLVLIEHVAADGGALRTVQRVIDPVWRVAARGCRLTRDTAALLDEHGFDTAGLRGASLPLPPPARPGIVGVAVA